VEDRCRDLQRELARAKLADLRDRGVITAAEFEREKAEVLT
jgi:hypothetical protein